MIALYPRVSTQEQATEGYSIEEQIDRLKKYCEAMGWNEYRIYTDAGYSGANTDRPALQEMIRDIKDGKIKRVVVYKLDRLSRSQKDTLELIEDVFLANDCEFESVSERFDTSSPYGRAMIGILAVFAQLEREQIKERMSMGREGRAKKGKWRGGSNVPIGYDFIEGNLEPNEFEKMQIVEIFNLFLQGHQIGTIERLFLEKGYAHKYGKWNAKRIKLVLSNKLYLGQVEYNGTYYEGEHEAFVTQENFEKAQKILESRKHSHRPPTRSYLGGLIHCKKCTAKYINCYNRSASGEYRYYSCHSRRKQNRAMIKDPNCKNKTYREHILDEFIFEQIELLALDLNHIQKIRNENVNNQDAEKIQTIQKEIEKIYKKRSRYSELFSEELYTFDELQEKVKPLNEQKKALETELESLTNQETEITESEAIELVTSFSDIIKRGNYEEIRLTVESLIKKIEIDEDNIRIYWKFA